MLPELNLDNESFENIMTEARNMIISLYPDWTDFNYHDPGITLIEMFSWLKEGQQFFLDQISDESREKYLKLLGIRPRHKAPASASVFVEAPEDLTVLKGTRLLAGDICFETDEKKQLIKDDVVACFCAAGDILGAAGEKTMGFGHNLGLPVFGSSPEAGNCFYMQFSHPLPQGEALSLYLELSWEYPVKRPNPQAMAAPMARISMEYMDRGAWREVEGFTDHTGGVTRPGFLKFRLPGPMGEGEVFGRQGYFLRLVLLEQEYDVPPVLSYISMNQLSLRQRRQVAEAVRAELVRTPEGRAVCRCDTLMCLNGKNELYAWSAGSCRRILRFTKTPDFDTGVSEFQLEEEDCRETPDEILVVSCLAEDMDKRALACADGFPNQEYNLDQGDTEYESFQILVQDTGNPLGYTLWTKVDDFSASGPQDSHYVLDCRNQTLRFGDCIHGMAPQGEILVISMARTVGRAGNVKAGKIDRFEGLEPEDMAVYNRSDGHGGMEEETLDEAFLRARRELKSPFTAVCDQDYERYVMETPGLLIESCKVIPAARMKEARRYTDGTEVNIVVKPFSPGKRHGLSGCYKKNILAYLEPRRMVGRRIHLLSPQYVSFDLYGDIVLQPHYISARETVRETVESYFQAIYNQFGVTLQYSSLYGIIDMLPCVARINALNLDARGTGVRRSRDGAVKLPPNGVACLGDIQFLFSIGE
ncbi:MAG: baseplate J/gp47 family protein [Clostridium sp.]|nr:baseplate J/gp47 family protein [Clostridium sp.]